MSDTNDDRPVDATPDTSAPSTPPAEASAATPAPSAEATATDAATPVPPVPPTPSISMSDAASTGAPQTPAAAPNAPAAAPNAPAQSPAERSPAAPTAPAASSAPAPQPAAPTRPVAPGPVPPGYVLQSAGQPRPPAYGAAPTYAGYAAPARPQNPTATQGQAYAGQPPYGGAFGRPGDTQPTLPLAGAIGAPDAPQKQKQKSGAGKVAGLIVAAALVGGAAGLGGSYAGLQLFAPSIAIPATGPGTVTVNNTDEVGQTTAIAAKVVPSVVTIAAASNSGSGTGSGVVLTSDGYVVTNTHVVTLDGATGGASVRVTTSDGRVYDAEVVGTDPTYDLAVIKLVDAEGLTPIEFADSSDLNVGDGTIAVGAPLGLSSTVTTGIVSALNRSIEIASAAAPDSEGEGDGGDRGDAPFFFDFGQGQGGGQAAESIKISVIQTDAAINPGNSGGALVDAEGKLIGINVAIASAGGSSGAAGSIGVGFAIPSNVVERITGELIEDGVATHGLLGASVSAAAYVEGASMTGAYIQEIVEGGAAADADLRVGDIVTGFNEFPITDSVDLTAQVRAAAAGSDAIVTFVRDGETRTVEVTLGELP